MQFNLSIYMKYSSNKKIEFFYLTSKNNLNFQAALLPKPLSAQMRDLRL